MDLLEVEGVIVVIVQLVELEENISTRIRLDFLHLFKDTRCKIKSTNQRLREERGRREFMIHVVKVIVLIVVKKNISVLL